MTPAETIMSGVVPACVLAGMLVGVVHAARGRGRGGIVHRMFKAVLVGSLVFVVTYILITALI